jgi:hypothetical protein
VYRTYSSACTSQKAPFFAPNAIRSFTSTLQERKKERTNERKKEKGIKERKKSRLIFACFVAPLPFHRRRLNSVRQIHCKTSRTESRRSTVTQEMFFLMANIYLTNWVYFDVCL